VESDEESDDEDDWVPCVKVFNPTTGRYEAAAAAAPLTPPGFAPASSPSKPKPPANPPAAARIPARDRLSPREMPSSPHRPRAVAAAAVVHGGAAAAAAAADGAQAKRLEAELAAARVKAEHAEDLAEQLRLQVL